MASCFSTDILFSLHGFFSLDGIATSNAITLKQEPNNLITRLLFFNKHLLELNTQQ